MDEAVMRLGAGGEAEAVPVARRILSRALTPVLRSGRWLADVMMPPACLSCRAPLASHEALCVACWGKVTFIRPPLCDITGVPLPFGGSERLVSAAALADPPAYDRARAVAHFDGVMRQLIHGFKFADRHDSRGLFARWMTEAGKDLLSDAQFVIPVPLARVRLLQRRYNQAAILAQDVARLAGKIYLPQGLDRIRRTRSQVGLTRAERQINVQGAFRVSEEASARIRGARVVLIDDIVTTGATVSAAAKALKRAGASRVDILALALVVEPAETLS